MASRKAETGLPEQRITCWKVALHFVFYLIFYLYACVNHGALKPWASAAKNSPASCQHGQGQQQKLNSRKNMKRSRYAGLFSRTCDLKLPQSIKASQYEQMLVVSAVRLLHITYILAIFAISTLHRELLANFWPKAPLWSYCKPSAIWFTTQSSLADIIDVFCAQLST